MNLGADFQTNEKRVIHKWLHYFLTHEQYSGCVVYRPAVLWEIGTDAAEGRRGANLAIKGRNNLVDRAQQILLTSSFSFQL
jgi:hypothetical protein